MSSPLEQAYVCARTDRLVADHRGDRLASYFAAERERVAEVELVRSILADVEPGKEVKPGDVHGELRYWRGMAENVAFYRIRLRNMRPR